MSQEIRGLENNIRVRMIYLDTKEEVLFNSIAQANRKTNINAQITQPNTKEAFYL